MEHQLHIRKTARYHTHGEDPAQAEVIWFVLHGYGQLSKYFVRHFHVLDPKRHYVVAPEGLHRFYLEGFSGRVGATWMTKEARLDDIEDYVAYLRQVYDTVRRTNPNARVVGLGFSQGVATLSRWMALGGQHFDAAVFWAGSFPPDLEPIQVERAFGRMTVHALAGDSDPFLDPDQLKRSKSHFANLGIFPKWIHYQGGHTIVAGPLKKLARELTDGW